jgi:hypothetical protein
MPACLCGRVHATRPAARFARACYHPHPLPPFPVALGCPARPAAAQIAEAKEVTAFSSQYKEAKHCRANEAYQLLARSVTWASCARPLLSLVTQRLADAGQPRVRTKLAQLLAFAARGVHENPTAGPCELMVFVVSEMNR